MVNKEYMMHRFFGSKTEKRCGECRNLIAVEAGNKKVFKCLIYGNTASEASDWRLKYIACGKFNIPIKRTDTPVIKIVKRMKKSVLNPPLEGQMRIDDFE